MERRDLLRLLATGAVLQLAPGKLMAVARASRQLLDSQTGPRTLNPQQFATVRQMAEMIIPRTETPGATDVGVADFIDLLLTEWFEDRERTTFLNGLGDVDARSQRLFAKAFLECSEMQQAAIVTELGEQMVEEEDRRKDHPASAAHTEMSFYPMFRRLTLSAYYTSEAGATQELHFEIIPDRFDPCAPAPAAKEAAKS